MRAATALREGDAHRWLSRLALVRRRQRDGDAEAERAVQLLEPLQPGPELAMAYSNMAQLRMLAGDVAGTRGWGDRAIELAERLGEPRRSSTRSTTSAPPS